MEKFKTAHGVEHGMVEEIANSIPDHGYKNLSESNRKEMLERKKKDIQWVDVKYQNLNNQETGKWEGWDAEYPGVSMKFFRFLHGFKYKVPRGLVRKINAMGAPRRSGLVDPQGGSLNLDGPLIQTHQLVAATEF